MDRNLAKKLLQPNLNLPTGWRYEEPVGGQLVFRNEDLVLVTGPWVSVFSSTGSEVLAVAWSGPSLEGSRDPIDIYAYYLDSLSLPIGKPESLRQKVIASCPPDEKLRIPVLPAGRHQGPISKLIEGNEVLLLNISLEADDGEDSAQVAIYAWRPSTGVVEVFPQTWFTRRNIDLGYQALSRVARDPSTQRFLAFGLRLPIIELDDTGCAIKLAIASHDELVGSARYFADCLGVPFQAE